LQGRQPQQRRQVVVFGTHASQLEDAEVLQPRQGSKTGDRLVFSRRIPAGQRFEGQLFQAAQFGQRLQTRDAGEMDDGQPP